MKSVLLLICVFVPALTFGGELYDLYWAEKKKLTKSRKLLDPMEQLKLLSKGSEHSRSDTEVKSDKHGITEMGLERMYSGGCDSLIWDYAFLNLLQSVGQ